jgi:hypothetical protein
MSLAAHLVLFRPERQLGTFWVWKLDVGRGLEKSFVWVNSGGVSWGNCLHFSFRFSFANG